MNHVTEQSFVLDEQERFMIKSWTKITSTLKYLFFVYLFMFFCTLLMFADSSSQAAFLKVILGAISIVTLFLTLVTTMLVMVIYQGRPNAELKDSLLNYHDLEGIATANNFYRTIIKMHLWPVCFMTALLLISQIFPDLSLLSKISTLPFLLLVIVSLVLLYRAYLFIKKARRSIDPALFEGNTDNS